VREVVWDRCRFLGEEGREEDKDVKRAGCSPWKRVGIAALGGIAALDDMVAGTVALAGTVVGTVVGIALV
jgi:hypothetical protein